MLPVPLKYLDTCSRRRHFMPLPSPSASDTHTQQDPLALCFSDTIFCSLLPSLHTYLFTFDPIYFFYASSSLGHPTSLLILAQPSFPFPFSPLPAALYCTALTLPLPHITPHLPCISVLLSFLVLSIFRQFKLPSGAADSQVFLLLNGVFTPG